MKTKSYLISLARQARKIGFLLTMAAVLVAAHGAVAASLSELLEKGIYAEETKGDLDAALRLYQQVVTEAKGGQALAAQAQYRLGVCYYKKKYFAEATAAFEKLVKDYPEQKELVAFANKYLAGAAVLLPAPWVDGEELRLAIKFPTGVQLGSATYSVRAAEVNGGKIWRLRSMLSAGPLSCSRVEVEADSFKPLYSYWKHPIIGEAEVRYTSTEAELKQITKGETKKIELDGVVYDNEEVIQLVRRLPLALGYKTDLRILPSLNGSVLGLKFEVTSQEEIQVPAGKFECFKVELSLRQTFWYSTDAHRYLVKFEAGGIVAELVEVNQRKAGEPVKFQDPARNFSLVAPADWSFDRQEPEGAKGKVITVAIRDPEAATTSVLYVQDLAYLGLDANKPVRDWAEQEVAIKWSKTMKDLQIRPDSWKERKVAGRPGLSVVADYIEGQEKKVAYGVFSVGKSNASKFFFYLGAEAFEGFQSKLDAIVDSYQVN